MYDRDQAGKLLTRQEYDVALTELRARYPWAGAAIIRPAPGHLGIVGNLLQEVEEISGANNVQAIEFLRIAVDYEHELQVYAHIDFADTARPHALASAIHQAKRVSGSTCAACGRRLERSIGQPLCEEHKGLVSLFSGEDVEQVLETESTAGEVKGVIRKPIFTKSESEDWDDAMETQAIDEMEGAADNTGPGVCPQVRIFDSDDVEKIIKSSERNSDRDQQNRLRNLAKRLKAVEPYKPLARVPEVWTDVIAGLLKDFPNFEQVIEFIGDQMALSRLGDGRLRLPPLLMLGPPGIGKTELALTLSEIFSVNSLLVDMASAQSGSTLCGSDSFWSNSEHGQLLETLLFGSTANPVVMLEELDKATADSRYSPNGPLYALLEERTASRFADLSVKDLIVDASHVIWLASANDLDAIPEPLRSRFNIFDVPAPSREQCRAIVRSIYGRLREKNGWGGAFSAELEETVEVRLASVPPRLAKALLLRACGHAARLDRTHVTLSDVEQVVRAEKEGIGFLANIV